jgi:hypothetical protein
MAHQIADGRGVSAVRDKLTAEVVSKVCEPHGGHSGCLSRPAPHTLDRVDRQIERDTSLMSTVVWTAASSAGRAISTTKSYFMCAVRATLLAEGPQ